MPRITKRQRFQSFLETKGWSGIGRPEWELLRAGLPDIPEASLRDWLQEAGVPVDQPYRGVRAKSFEELEESLSAMTELYARDPAAGKICRSLVISAKDRARFASRNPKVDEAKRAAKEEMVRWMLVWLYDPAMFPAWSRLRRAQEQRRGAE
jgi:hypothetical protein